MSTQFCKFDLVIQNSGSFWNYPSSLLPTMSFLAWNVLLLHEPQLLYVLMFFEAVHGQSPSWGDSGSLSSPFRQACFSQYQSILQAALAVQSGRQLACFFCVNQWPVFGVHGKGRGASDGLGGTKRRSLNWPISSDRRGAKIWGEIRRFLVGSER